MSDSSADRDALDARYLNGSPLVGFAVVESFAWGSNGKDGSRHLQPAGKDGRGKVHIPEMAMAVAGNCFTCDNFCISDLHKLSIITRRASARLWAARLPCTLH